MSTKTCNTPGCNTTGPAETFHGRKCKSCKAAKSRAHTASKPKKETPLIFYGSVEAYSSALETRNTMGFGKPPEREAFSSEDEFTKASGVHKECKRKYQAEASIASYHKRAKNDPTFLQNNATNLREALTRSLTVEHNSPEAAMAVCQARIDVQQASLHALHATTVEELAIVRVPDMRATRHDFEIVADDAIPEQVYCLKGTYTFHADRECIFRNPKATDDRLEFKSWEEFPDTLRPCRECHMVVSQAQHDRYTNTRDRAQQHKRKAETTGPTTEDEKRKQEERLRVLKKGIQARWRQKRKEEQDILEPVRGYTEDEKRERDQKRKQEERAVFKQKVECGGISPSEIERLRVLKTAQQARWRQKKKEEQDILEPVRGYTPRPDGVSAEEWRQSQDKERKRKQRKELKRKAEAMEIPAEEIERLRKLKSNQQARWRQKKKEEQDILEPVRIYTPRPDGVSAEA